MTQKPPDPVGSGLFLPSSLTQEATADYRPELLSPWRFSICFLPQCTPEVLTGPSSAYKVVTDLEAFGILYDPMHLGGHDQPQLSILSYSLILLYLATYFYYILLPDYLFFLWSKVFSTIFSSTTTQKLHFTSFRFS